MPQEETIDVGALGGSLQMSRGSSRRGEPLLLQPNTVGLNAVTDCERSECDSLCTSDALPINVAAVPDCHNHNQQNVVMNRVKDPVIANSQSEAVSPTKRTRRRRAWIKRQECNGALNSRLNRAIDFPKFTQGCRTKLNLVLGHPRPRSLRTCSHGMFSPSSSNEASKAALSWDSSRASCMASYCAGLTITAARCPCCSSSTGSVCADATTSANLYRA